jgi:hypothetical protein
MMTRRTRSGRQFLTPLASSSLTRLSLHRPSLHADVPCAGVKMYKHLKTAALRTLFGWHGNTSAPSGSQATRPSGITGVGSHALLVQVPTGGPVMAKFTELGAAVRRHLPRHASFMGHKGSKTLRQEHNSGAVAECTRPCQVKRHSSAREGAPHAMPATSAALASRTRAALGESDIVHQAQLAAPQSAEWLYKNELKELAKITRVNKLNAGSATPQAM